MTTDLVYSIRGGHVQNLGSVVVGRFIVLSFLIMGWAFYELSGGSDFVPESRAVAAIDTDTAPEIATRADTATLASLDDVPASTVQSGLTLPLLQPDTATALPDAVAADIAAAVAAVVAEPEPAAAPEVTLASAPATLDLRQVAGDRVNMREGPGTGYGVVVTLTQGTRAEVLEFDTTGWVRIRVIESDQTGWMAERLLSVVSG